MTKTATPSASSLPGGAALGPVGWWRSLPRGLRGAVVFAGLLVLLMASVGVVDRATRGRESRTYDSRGSARSTATNGAKAFRLLLGRYGIVTTDLRGSLRTAPRARTDLAADTTVFILDAPFPSDADRREVRGYRRPRRPRGDRGKRRWSMDRRPTVDHAIGRIHHHGPVRPYLYRRDLLRDSLVEPARSRTRGNPRSRRRTGGARRRQLVPRKPTHRQTRQRRIRGRAHRQPRSRGIRRGPARSERSHRVGRIPDRLESRHHRKCARAVTHRHRPRAAHRPGGAHGPHARPTSAGIGRRARRRHRSRKTAGRRAGGFANHHPGRVVDLGLTAEPTPTPSPMHQSTPLHSRPDTPNPKPTH